MSLGYLPKGTERTLRQPLLTWFLAWFVLYGAAAQGQSDLSDAESLHEAQYALLDLIRHDVFSAPVASRVYTYANIAFYETLRLAEPERPGVSGRLNGFDEPPPVAAKLAFDARLAAYVAFWKTAQALLFSDDSADARLQRFLAAWHEQYGSLTEGSLHVGQIMADWVLKRASSDNYAATRKMKRYQHRSEEGFWIPTPPDYAEALEPHWGKIKPLALEDAAQFRPARPPAYDTNGDSAFMQEVQEVYAISRNLDSSARLVALYWDDNPSTTVLSGHITYTIKKFSPGAHWLLIAMQALRQTRADLHRSSKTYLLVSVALFDGFISCWEEKYFSERVRPVTVIQRHLDYQWQPLIQTPPFPEYTSGHSVVSAAAATVLTALFGADFAFTDSAEVRFGLPARQFSSFHAAAAEASHSRLLGGIHFRSGLSAGQQQGRQVGEQVLQRLLY
ncbi:MAG: vanadium-dependent haloperoxidase [Chitinophagales bacterium]|nr:vanadium-dependent haloperoxidase [Chitinophagales bacterium]MDW8394558.1 vanadium-dependent haloperoxidase [Chitinophagales bacterium]